jgi:hypothetical protein
VESKGIKVVLVAYCFRGAGHTVLCCSHTASHTVRCSLHKFAGVPLVPLNTLPGGISDTASYCFALFRALLHVAFFVELHSRLRRCEGHCLMAQRAGDAGRCCVSVRIGRSVWWRLPNAERGIRSADGGMRRPFV